MPGSIKQSINKIRAEIIATKIRIQGQGNKTKIPHKNGGFSLTLKTTNMK
jgi:hypothetical protein